MRVAAARARGDLTESQEIIAEGVTKFARRAQLAAFRDDPVPNRLANWWRGTLPEAAYRQMHTARTQMIDLYDENELQAEIPSVVARANASLHRDDPRQLTVEELRKDPAAVRRARIRRLVGDSYERLDLEYAQLRSFRNILLSAAAFLLLVTIATIVFVSINPDLMPLCFPGACPTSNGASAHPQSTDIQVVAVLGALGGALAATLSIRNLKGTSTPYDVTDQRGEGAEAADGAAGRPRRAGESPRPTTPRREDRPRRHPRHRVHRAVPATAQRRRPARGPPAEHAAGARSAGDRRLPHRAGDVHPRRRLPLPPQDRAPAATAVRPADAPAARRRRTSCGSWPCGWATREASGSRETGGRRRRRADRGTTRRVTATPDS